MSGARLFGDSEDDEPAAKADLGALENSLVERRRAISAVLEFFSASGQGSLEAKAAKAAALTLARHPGHSMEAGVLGQALRCDPSFVQPCENWQQEVLGAHPLFASCDFEGHHGRRRSGWRLVLDGRQVSSAGRRAPSSLVATPSPAHRPPAPVLEVGQPAPPSASDWVVQRTAAVATAVAAAAAAAARAAAAAATAAAAAAAARSPASGRPLIETMTESPAGGPGPAPRWSLLLSGLARLRGGADGRSRSSSSSSGNDGEDGAAAGTAGDVHSAAGEAGYGVSEPTTTTASSLPPSSAASTVTEEHQPPQQQSQRAGGLPQVWQCNTSDQAEAEPSLHTTQVSQQQQQQQQPTQWFEVAQRLVPDPAGLPLTTTGDTCTLSAAMLKVVEGCSASEVEREHIRSTFERVQALLLGTWPTHAHFHMFGSSANGFAVRGATDLDMCMELPHPMDSRDIVDVIMEMERIFYCAGFLGVQSIPRATVPVCKATDPVTNLQVDVSVNNMLGTVNTHLLRCYSEIDPRLRQMVIFVKHWAKRRGINSAYRRTLSSYAYTLMCIFHLQTRKPPVLPVLQAMTEKGYNKRAGQWLCEFNDDVGSVRGFGAANTETLAELLASFFHYWACEHNYQEHVVSIRRGKILMQDHKEWRTSYWGQFGRMERHLMSIEDPFDLSHDLGRVVDSESLWLLQSEFRRAAQLMATEGDPLPQLLEPRVEGLGM